MREVLAAETRKLLTTKTALGLLVGGIVVGGLGTFSTISSAHPDQLVGPLNELPFYLLASINLSMFALILGIRSFTDEFRHGTIVPTALGGASRSLLLVGKSIVAALAAAVGASIALAVTYGLAVATAAMKGVVLAVSPADVAAGGRLAIGMAAWAILGVAIGSLVRHQVAGIVGGVVWVLVVENLGAGLLGDAGRFLPGQAVHALASAGQTGVVSSPGLGAAVLAVHVTVLGVVAMRALQRRDLI